MLQQAHSELERLKARLAHSSQEMVSIVVLAACNRIGQGEWVLCYNKLIVN